MKLLIIQTAALGYDFVVQNGIREWHGLTFEPLETVFPALTCTVQASFRTALTPEKHGITGNGFFSRELMKPFFWEQSARLVKGERIWDNFRATDKRIAMLFWQQSLGEDIDFLISPAPVHKHHGGMIQSCYSKPDDLYGKLCRSVGRSFDLTRYWGPLASAEASDWIASATSALLADRDIAPDLCLTYLPVLDYDLQRYGPESEKAKKTLLSLLGELKVLLTTATKYGYEVIIFGDYAINMVNKGAVLPNRKLLKAGLFKVRNVKGKLYPDFYGSASFALVDHEIAHVYIRSLKDIQKTADILKKLKGVGEVIIKQQSSMDITNDKAGDILLIADKGYWFAYPWWKKEKEAPDYAKHVDIHNKPGYDPCELFFGWPPFSVSHNHDRICGSHGRVGKENTACWTATCSFDKKPTSLIDLATVVREWMEKNNVR